MRGDEKKWGVGGGVISLHIKFQPPTKPRTLKKDCVVMGGWVVVVVVVESDLVLSFGLGQAEQYEISFFQIIFDHIKHP